MARRPIDLAARSRRHNEVRGPYAYVRIVLAAELCGRPTCVVWFEGTCDDYDEPRIGVTNRPDRTFADYLRIVRRRLPVVAVLSGLGLAGAVLLVTLQHHVYGATAADVVNLQSTPPGIAGLQSPQAINPNVYTATQAEVAASPPVAQLAVADAHIAGLSVSALLKATSVVPDINANYIRFTVTHGTAAGAKALANGLANAYLAFSRTQNLAQTNALLAQAVVQSQSLERAILTRPSHDPLRTTLLQQYGALLSQQTQLKALKTYQSHQSVAATNPAASAHLVQPKKAAEIIGGVAAGLLVGLLLAFALEGADRRVRTVAEISDVLGLPVLGHVTRRSGRSRDVGRTLRQGRSALDGNPYYAAGARIVAVCDRAGSKVLAVTSATSGEGKSTIAAQLATTLALGGRRVALVEFDFHGGRLAALFGVSPAPGIVDVALGSRRLSEAVRDVPVGGAAPATDPAAVVPAWQLLLFPAGQTIRSEPPLLDRHVVAELLGVIRRDVDFVIIDTPPVLSGSGGLALIQAADAALLVVRANRTTRESLTETRQTLAVQGVVTLGAFAVDAPRAASDDNTADYMLAPASAGTIVRR